MTEKIIAEIVGKDRVLAGHSMVCENVNHLLTGQQDLISVSQSGWLIEYEIKISRKDFFRDARKNKEESFSNPLRINKTPNYFYYVIPSGIVIPEEIPTWSGLYFIIDGKLSLIKKAPRIHSHKHDLFKIYHKVTTLYQQRHFLGCCLLTFRNKKIR